ncbi:hypothetical protein GQ457_07G013730 [Hibiscus cannabinus]
MVVYDAGWVLKMKGDDRCLKLGEGGNLVMERLGCLGLGVVGNGDGKSWGTGLLLEARCWGPGSVKVGVNGWVSVNWVLNFGEVKGTIMGGRTHQCKTMKMMNARSKSGQAAREHLGREPWGWQTRASGRRPWGLQSVVQARDHWGSSCCTRDTSGSGLNGLVGPGIGSR